MCDTAFMLYPVDRVLCCNYSVQLLCGLWRTAYNGSGVLWPHLEIWLKTCFHAPAWICF